MSSRKIQQQNNKERIAIVAEGGGQRGIFTAGVLDAFQQHQFQPFNLAIGVSSGAQNLLSYWLGEQGYARRAIQELTTRPGFFVPYRWLMARSVVDLDNYFAQVESHPEFRLPLEQFDPMVQRKPLVFVATSKRSGQPVYLEPTAETVMEHLKASSAVPFLYQKSVVIGDDELFDGGVADPVPVKRAYAMGARRIVVIRTLPGRKIGSGWRERLQLALRKQKLNPQLAQLLENHEHSFDSATDFICDPPSDATVLEISPPEPLHSQTFGSSSEELIHDYELGLAVGQKTIAKVKHWIDIQSAQ
ncbi:MAG: patatin family protein [Gammaproteobacteria bacterium]|nr:patatin family protein [Gammaproteobacteria bacterium]